MPFPLGVATVFAGLLIWVLLLIRGLQTGRYRGALYCGIALMLFMNIGYVLNGVPESIASFIGIYDVLINVGLSPDSSAAAVSNCAGNACTVWGDTYTQHPAWGAAFYDRFANGPELRSQLLYGHIVFNSIAFVLMHIQLFRPGYGRNRTSHQIIGKVSFICLTVSLVCSVWLASEHGAVEAYGGDLAAYGFYSMAAVVYACAIMGIVAIRRGREGGGGAVHRVWMFRYAGALWGSFGLFRVLLFFTDPLFRDYEAVAILISIWVSAPVGAVLGDRVRRRLDRTAGEAAQHGELVGVMN
jgi:hypothetical protein